MEVMNELMSEFKKQLEKGKIQKAYKYIFDLFSDLSKEIKLKDNNFYVSGSIYHGYLDMTYLPIFTDILKSKGLKIAVVFDYTEFKFEIWLSGNNKKIQKEIWEITKAKKWSKYKVLESLENEDSIVEYPIDEITNYNDKKYIVEYLHKKISSFIKDVESFIKANI